MAPPRALTTLADRFDPEVFPVMRDARVRLTGPGVGTWDAVLKRDEARLEEADADRRPDALIEADGPTWHQLATDLGGGMDAFRAGRLTVRHDLHLGVGFLAATADGGALRFRHDAGISYMEAGEGEPVVLLHGLGATKASFLPTLAALAPRGRRVIAVDLPGFGDSDKPLGGAYDASFFARGVIRLLDALGLERASFVGNSMGGRVALELGMAHADRTRKLVLLAPSLAWLRERPWAPLLKLVPPQLGVIQPAPRAIVEPIVRRLIPGAEDGWTAAGVDEFLRSYLSPAGRAAFYAAARNIYLEHPQDFWPRLESLTPPSLFVWGRHDPLVPLAFSRHVREAVPDAKHLELDCGHVPQLERPHVVHDAMMRFEC
jgi:pimeloyl-ACP methyl ester carboxylesterase